MEAAGEAVVTCAELGKRFGDEEVLAGVNLQIEKGSIVGLIGPSGGGKTTTVRLLTGLLAPTTGTATVWGTPATSLVARQRQQIGYMPQLPSLFPQLSLWENLSFHASMYGLRLRRRHRLHHVLEWVELDEHRAKKVCEVSGGMQRRLALAAAFVHDPTLVFLDEPTAGIDPILRSAFWEQFRALRDGGVTMCVTTQYVSEAAYCDYVGLLSEGELLTVVTPEDLRAAAFNGEVVDVELAHAVDAAELRTLGDMPGVLRAPEQVSARHWRIIVTDATAALEPLQAEMERLGLPVVEVREHVVDYDEAFVRVIERHRAERGEEPTVAAPTLVGGGR